MVAITIMASFYIEDMKRNLEIKKNRCLVFNQYLELASVTSVKIAIVMPNMCLIQLEKLLWA